MANGAELCCEGDGRPAIGGFLVGDWLCICRSKEGT